MLPYDHRESRSHFRMHPSRHQVKSKKANRAIMPSMATDEFDLPDLRTQPLWGRRILFFLILALLLLLPIAFWLDQIFEKAAPVDIPLRAVVCDEVLEGQALFRLDPSQSEMRYQVDEHLLEDNAFNSLVGRTNVLDGYIIVDFDHPENSKVCEMVVNISQMSSDNLQRDGIVRLRYLETTYYPEARFVPIELIGFPRNPREGESFNFQMAGDLTIKQTTAPETWKVSVKLADDVIEGSAETVILMSTYEVGPISIAGFVETSDDLSLTFDFVATRVEPETVLNPTPTP
jgi:polyisoprenoid-binding protein YceI